jgi:hypothetical protein
MGSAGSVQSGSTILQVLDAPLDVELEPGEAEPLAASSEAAAAANSAQSTASRVTTLLLSLR